MDRRVPVRAWLLIAGLCFFAPLGLYIAFRHYRFRKRVNIILALVSVPLFFAECAFGAIYFVANDIRSYPESPAIAAAAPVESSSAAESPSSVAESPSSIAESPSSVAESSSSVDESSSVAESSSSVAESPSSVAEPPSSVAESSQVSSSMLPTTGTQPEDSGKPMPAPGTPGPLG